MPTQDEIYRRFWQQVMNGSYTIHRPVVGRLSTHTPNLEKPQQLVRIKRLSDAEIEAIARKDITPTFYQFCTCVCHVRQGNNDDCGFCLAFHEVQIWRAFS